MVTAIIQPPKLQAVLTALEQVGVQRLTVFDAQGYGRQRGRTETYRGHEYNIKFIRKVELEIVVNDDYLERTVDTIMSVARTGQEGAIGDGKILIMDVQEAIQIGGDERGPSAV